MGIAKKLNLNFSNIIFEVIETELVKDQKHLQKILNFYKKQGFKIALDDVGEGYSNLNLLIDMKPDIIKIDRNIISEIDKSPMKKSVYKALYDIANSNGIKVLAEGIERIEEFKTLKSIGVDFVQGFYFGKPTPV
jgi:EAL domain-containing protein (putative c-di-GMP-specific phosphodiesterase class I)